MTSTRAPVIDDPDWSGPRPAPDAVNGPYFAACARGVLLVQRCPACGARQHYPRPLCVACAAEPEWEEVSGLGEVHTYTVIRQNGQAPFAAALPYVVAVIELVEGPRLLGALPDTDPGRVRIGTPVEAYMVRLTPDLAIPFWRLRS